MKRTSVLASTAALTLLSVMLVQACSGEEGGEDQGQGNLMGQGGQVAGVGGTAPGVGGTTPGASGAGVGGTGSEAQGGATNVAGQGGAATSPSTGGAPAAGAAGMPAAGAAGAPAQGGTGGAPPTGAPPACVEPPAPSNGVSCTVTCTDPCSIHQLGTRVCECPGEEVCDDGQTAPCYDCGTCVFINPNDPLVTVPPGPLPDCTDDDGVLEDAPTCTENDRCLSIRVNGNGVRNRFCGCRGGSWDCDSKPANFP